MDKLRVAIIQENLVWEDSSVNLRLFENYFEQIENADLVVLPEMFNSGFTMEPEKVAQPINGAAVQWIKEQSLKHNFSIIGSLVIAENSNYFNRMIMSFPCSDVRWYDKKHLFRMGGEHEKYEAGKRSVVFKYFGWRIRPLICYDLRFPVWSRNRNDYDVLVYVANWPAPRNDAWETLLKARAIENQCYVIAVNRVGADGNNVNYVGNSMIISPKGEVVVQMDNKPGMQLATLSFSDLQVFRQKFPVHLDADNFELR